LARVLSSFDISLILIKLSAIGSPTLATIRRLSAFSVFELSTGGAMKAALQSDVIAIVGSLIVGAYPIALVAAGIEDAKRDYQAACAVCHGRQARGDGPLKDELKTPVPDLTALARNNNGKFPSDRVIQIIDGREQVRAHGSREMPVWGNSFRLRDAGPTVASRIKALTEYLDRLQEK
jgi:mono/diheme cytochrome c family protein